MKVNAWLLIFFLALAGDIIGILTDNILVQYISKPLLVLSLLLVIGFDSRKHFSLKKWIILALFFSWVGDILLMFERNEPDFFLFGLAAFLLAHIFYIIGFHSLRVREEIRPQPYFLVIIIIYYLALMFLLSPHLGDMKLPVRIYGIVISFMFLLSLHLLFMKNKTAGRFMMMGAALFVLSDSLLAINKFYQPFAGAGIAIIVTYAFAQLLITLGAINYIRGRSLRAL